MRRSLATALTAALLTGHPLGAQLLDWTLVPKGQLQLQAYPQFTFWDARFGLRPDGTERRERLGDDLTDPTMLSIFPGVATLADEIRVMTGSSGYTPVLGSSQGRLTQDVTRIDFGAHIGVWDWLTIGAVLPWMRAHSAVDLVFVADSVNGNLGINPRVTDPNAVTAFIASTGIAEAAAQRYATAKCGTGGGGACTAAQALSGRVSAMHTSAQSAYGASPFFPIVGSHTAASLAQAVSLLSADLIASGLGGLTVPMAFATDWLTSEGLVDLPATAGAGIDAAPLHTRKGLWDAGDVEVSVLARVLDSRSRNSGNTPSFLGYRITLGLLARLPTGLPEDPNILMDVGTGDAQTDLEGSLIASLAFGSRVALRVGARYGVQGATTITKRVVAPELAIPPVATRQDVTWKPGVYVGAEVAPAIRLTRELSLIGQYRFFHKERDVFELKDFTASLDPSVLAIESQVTTHQVGGGLRYDTVHRWLEGEAARPLQIHVRVLHTIEGSGGQTPVATRIEAGIRLFKRLWGPQR